MSGLPPDPGRPEAPVPPPDAGTTDPPPAGTADDVAPAQPPVPHDADDIPWSDDFLWPHPRLPDVDAWIDSPAPAPTAFRRSLLVAVLAVLVALLIWSGRPPSPDPLPTDLLGRWTTQSPVLADRAFVLSLGEIAFDQGGGRSVRYAIRGVRHDRVNAVQRYRITYGAEGGEAVIDLEYDPTARTLRLASRPGVTWRR